MNFMQAMQAIAQGAAVTRPDRGRFRLATSVRPTFSAMTTEHEGKQQTIVKLEMTRFVERFGNEGKPVYFDNRYGDITSKDWEIVPGSVMPQEVPQDEVQSVNSTAPDMPQSANRTV